MFVQVADEACLNYKPNQEWMRKMRISEAWPWAVAQKVPCETCGVTREWHPYT